MQLFKVILYIMPLLLIASAFSQSSINSTVLICYGKLVPRDIKGYRIVILEPRYYLPLDIENIKLQNEKVYAYLSLGEVNENAPHYNFLKNSTLGRNEIWNSYYLNLKSEKTISTLINIVETVFAMGYDGLFLDNIDNFTISGPQEKQRKELINLLKTLKTNYNDKGFIQNAGLEIIDETCQYIDAIIIESVATDYNFKDKIYKLRNRQQYDSIISEINLIENAYKLPIILVEYANSKKLYNTILERIQPTKKDYFIGTIDLQTIPNFKK